MEDRRRKTRKVDKMKIGLLSLVVTLIIAMLGWGANSQSVSNDITRQLLQGQGVTNERLSNQIDSFKEQKIETKEGFDKLNNRMRDMENKVQSIKESQQSLEYRANIYWPETKNDN